MKTSCTALMLATIFAAYGCGGNGDSGITGPGDVADTASSALAAQSSSNETPDASSETEASSQPAASSEASTPDISSSSVADNSQSSNDSGALAPVTEIHYYVFGHSLFMWNTQTEPGSEAESATGYWLGALAQASGVESAGTGQWGQLDYHRIPAEAQWTLETNTFTPWPSGSFADQDFSHVIVMPSNFEQTHLSPSDYMAQTERVIDYILSEEPNTTITLYEHWPKPADAGPIVDQTDLTDAEWSTTKDYTLGNYHNWFVEWQNLIVARYPNANIRMIPIGPVIAQLLNNSPYLANIDYQDLYVDDAPHGSRTKYLLAAMVTYRALHQSNPSTRQ